MYCYTCHNACICKHYKSIIEIIKDGIVVLDISRCRHYIRRCDSMENKGTQAVTERPAASIDDLNSRSEKIRNISKDSKTQSLDECPNCGAKHTTITKCKYCGEVICEDCGIFSAASSDGCCEQCWNYNEEGDKIEHNCTDGVTVVKLPFPRDPSNGVVQ